MLDILFILYVNLSSSQGELTWQRNQPLKCLGESSKSKLKEIN